MRKSVRPCQLIEVDDGEFRLWAILMEELFKNNEKNDRSSGHTPSIQAEGTVWVRGPPAATTTRRLLASAPGLLTIGLVRRSTPSRSPRRRTPSYRNRGTVPEADSQLRIARRKGLFQRGRPGVGRC